MVIDSVKRAGGRRSTLCIDGDHLFTVEDEALSACGFAAGQTVSQQQLDELLAQSCRLEAKRRALSLLSSRSYTCSRLIDRIAATVGTQAAEAAVERMAELGLIDDDAYAERLSRELYENRRWAVRRIRFELSRHGVPEDAADRATAQFDPEEEPGRAEELLRDRFGTLASDAARRRACALLERYGYRADAIRFALRSVLRDETEE